MSIAWILGAAATAAAAVLTERRLIYKPVRHVLQNLGHLDLAFEDVTFAASDGTALNGWWLPRAGAHGTILHCHGNKGSLGDRAWIARDLSALPYNVFMFDYRGYGLSRGVPTAAGTRLDVLAAWDEVRRRHGGADHPPIALFGSSLGGATAAQLAAERPVRCLILEGTFTSTLDMGRRFYPWLFPRLTCHNRYETLAKVRAFEMPLLVAHSPDDAVIPFDMGRALYDAAPSAHKRFVELGGPHGEYTWRTSPGYREAFADFLAEHLPAPAAVTSLRPSGSA